MIKTIDLKCRTELTALACGRINLFVGANNSGKSTLLREIQKRFSGDIESNFKIINKIIFEKWPLERMQKFFYRNGQLIPKNNPHYSDYNSVYMLNGESGSNFHALETVMRSIDSSYYDQHPSHDRFLYNNTMFADGQTRFSLSQPRSFGTTKDPAQNSYRRMFDDRKKRKQFQEYILKSIGMYPLFHYAGNGLIIMMLSEKLPENILIEEGIGPESQNYYNYRCQELQSVGDGVKCFIGILCELSANTPLILIIDEPEAFLHPTLARKLGQLISRFAIEEDFQVFAATHNSHFVFGCLDETDDVQITRLERNKDNSNFKTISNKLINEFRKKPILRSSGVFDAIFCESSVVCESDSDRIFYQEISRIVKKRDSRPTTDSIFLSCGGKQQIPNIVKMQRTIGVPAVGIFDIDFLRKTDGTDTSLIMNCFGIPTSMAHSIGAMRSDAFSVLNKDHRNWKKTGITNLGKADHKTVQSCLAMFAEYGLFIVPVGELESWLPQHDDKRKSEWLTHVSEKIENNELDFIGEPNHPHSLAKFLADVQRWIENPDRSGMDISEDGIEA